MASHEEIKRVLEALQEQDLDSVLDAVEACGGIVGVEDVLHPKEGEWEVIVDLLEDYSGLEEEEDLREASRELWGLIFHLGQAGVEARLIAGSCGLCDEFHAWVAAPAAQVRALLRRVHIADLCDVDLNGIHRIPGARVEYGPRVLLRRVRNEAGGYYEEFAWPIAVVLNRDDYAGVYEFVDVINDGPTGVGNSGQLRVLWTREEFESQADWGDIQLAWGR